MADFWDILKYLWESAYNFLNQSVVTIGSVDISLWAFAIGFVLLGFVLGFVVDLLSD